MRRLAALLVLGSASAALAAAPPQREARYESTTTATVKRIERASRVLTLVGEGNVFHTIHVDPSITAFDDLQVGDEVTVRYTESVIVNLRPDARPSPRRDTTAEAVKAQGSDVIEQMTIVVTIESIDSQRLFVGYRTHDNMRGRYPVKNRELLDGIRSGDRVEITLTRARAVHIERKRR